MGWLADATDPTAWRESPGTTAAEAVGCVLLAPFCLAHEAGAAAGREAGRRTANAATAAAEGARATVQEAGGAGGFFDEAAGGFERVADATTRPIDSTTELVSEVKWVVIAILALVVVGALWYVIRQFV